MTPAASVFDLPDRLAAKANPALIGGDELHFTAIADNLRRTVTDLSERLSNERKAPGRAGQEALERDLEIHRLTARLKALRRFGIDLCLGRIASETGEVIYIGRLGLLDEDSKPLLVDWRSPAAEPFFGATHAHPLGLASRRRYRWTGARISDYWDEVFTGGELASSAALDDESAFIASLGSSRDLRMRDVLGTIQADQDAIIRAPSRGALVVDGGPGTGKTVVALHRSAYLLYSDPRLAKHHGGLLFVGPHDGYLAYIDDVLPSLGEDAAQTCTIRNLVAEGAAAGPEPDERVAGLKGEADPVRLLEAAVKHYERPPSRGMTIETPWADVWLSPAEWAEAFDSADAGTPHNEARDQVWEALLDILNELLVDAAQLDEGEVSAQLLRRSLLQNEELAGTFAKRWPLLDPVGVLGDLWSVPAYLRQSAPWLSEGEVQLLQRAEPRAWTLEDLPFLDAARRRIGDPDASRRRHRRDAAIASEREERSRVVDELIQSDDSELMIMSMLRGDDLQNTLVDESALPTADPDALAGPFAHVVVDEAQELTDAQWQMLLARCPSRSFTIVGDRAQARHGFTETWRERLNRIGLDDVEQTELTINYRTPSEVMAEAAPVIRAVLPDANVPTSIRESGIPVMHGGADELDGILDGWLAENAEGIACVISASGAVRENAPALPRVRFLAPELSKGLEFDLVILVDPETFGDGITGTVDRYVAMTRATQRLVVLTS